MRFTEIKLHVVRQSKILKRVITRERVDTIRLSISTGIESNFSSYCVLWYIVEPPVPPHLPPVPKVHKKRKKLKMMPKIPDILKRDFLGV